MKLECEQISCGYGARTVLKDIDLSLSSGEALCLLGPNGVGKTTIFKTILGFLSLQAGSILLDEKDMRKWPKKKLSQAIAYVPQAHIPPFPFLVSEVVLMGRNAHLNSFGVPTTRDRHIAYESLERLGISDIKDKPYTEISGGERQLVLVARALAQESKLLLLDEPTSNLDFGNQMRVLEQIRKIVNAGIGVLMTTHSPNHAFLCATRVALLGQQNSLIIGQPTDVLTEKNLFDSFGVAVHRTFISAREGYADTYTCVPLLPNKL